MSGAPCGGATLTVTVSGVDVSCDVVSVDIQRGKTRLWDPMSASDCQLVINAGIDGQPHSRGPAGQAIVTVAVTYGSTHRTIFTGTVQQQQVESTPEGTFLQLYAVDAFEQLARVNRVAAITDTAVGSMESVDDRISRWLDEAGWSGGRVLSVSDFTCPEIIIDGNVLANIKATAVADGGDFFIDGDGNAAFRSWAWRNLVDDLACFFSDRMLYDWVPYSSSVYRDDGDEIQNKVAGVRRKWDSTDPIPQIADNPSSITTYGERGDALKDLELVDDTQVATRVTNAITVAAQPSPRFDPVVVQPRFKPSRMWPSVLAIEWGSLVATNRLWADGTETALYGHVIGERWKLTANDATIVYRVSGTATWDAIRIPRTPIGGRIDPITGKYCIPLGYPCPEGLVIFKDADGTVTGTFPPGSLCYCETGGGVVPPDGSTQVCIQNEIGEICTPITDPRLTALLWFDVYHHSTTDLIEWIQGVAVEGMSGWQDNTVGAIPPVPKDSINATVTGGAIGASHSDHVAAATLSGGWTVEWYLDAVGVTMDADTYIDIIDLDSIKMRLRATATTAIIQLVVWITATDGDHGSGALYDIPGDDWHHYVVSWDPTAVAGELSVFVDGTEVT